MTPLLFNGLPLSEQIGFINETLRGNRPLGKANELIFPGYTIFFQVALFTDEIIHAIAMELPKKRKRMIGELLEQNGKSFLYAVHDKNEVVKKYFFDAIQRHKNLRN